ncbi:MAG TPA: hypothetical protein VGG06_01785 [Thermoanaerobaculia bacterium]
MILDVIPLSRDGAWNRELIGLLEEKTGEKLGYDVESWYAWLWAREPRLHPLYPELKAAVYGLLDPKFRGYFSKERTTLIRLELGLPALAHQLEDVVAVLRRQELGQAVDDLVALGVRGRESRREDEREQRDAGSPRSTTPCVVCTAITLADLGRNET